MQLMACFEFGIMSGPGRGGGLDTLYHRSAVTGEELLLPAFVN